MSKLETLEREIKQLSVAELTQVRAWLDELEADAWDAQIEADSLAGRLNHLITNALEEESAGRWKHL